MSEGHHLRERSSRLEQRLAKFETTQLRDMADENRRTLAAGGRDETFRRLIEQELEVLERILARRGAQ